MLGPEDVYRLDINARWWGIPTELLMESAGKNIADIILERYPESRKIVIVSSRTNNGGDGLVAARHLSRHKKVTVVFIGYPELIRSQEAKLNWEFISRSFSIDKVIIKRREDLQKLEKILEDTDIVIDAIFGIGIKGTPRGLEADAIKYLNKLKEKFGFKIVSVDVPSGLDVYKGEPTEVMIQADLVVTFHDVKKGLDKVKSEVIVWGIGIPVEAEIFVGPGDFINVLRDRDAWSHKGNYGRILIIGGSRHYSGAPTLSALAALRAGADLTVIYAPENIANAIRGLSPNLIVESYKGSNLGDAPIKELIEFSKSFDVVVVGPGIGREEKTLRKTFELINEISQEVLMVVDADGLHAIARFGIPKNPENIVITPHAGEFKAIFGELPPTDIYRRAEIVQKYASKHNITILLKGHIDIIATRGKLKYNATGNPGMTVGGTGDVLTGIVATFLSQTKDPFASATLGAFLCGLAGDLAFEKYGYQLLATDVIEHIPSAIKKIRNYF